MTELERGRVAHAVPGRVRIKIEPRALADERGVQLQRALLALPDVEEIRTTPRTGSVVVGLRSRRARHTWPDRPGPPGPAAGHRPAVRGPVRPPAGPAQPRPRGASATFSGGECPPFRDHDGRWDLRSVAAVRAGALALRSVCWRIPGAITAAPWYVFAWYAFDSFWKLNQDQDRVAERRRYLETRGRVGRRADVAGNVAGRRADQAGLRLPGGHRAGAGVAAVRGRRSPYLREQLRRRVPRSR